MIAHFIFFVCYIAIVLIFTYLDFTNEELKRKNDSLETQLNMNIRLIQITKEVFESLSKKESTYFVNGMIPWRRAWQPTAVFLPGESPWTEEPGGLQSMGSQSYSHAFRETNSLRRTMQIVECSLLHRRAQGRVSS